MIETNIIKSIIKNKLGLISYPSFITFIVTWRCNGHCIFCDVWKKHPNIKEELSVDEIKNIFSQLKNIDVLRLSGGEPFLRNDLAEIINAIDEINSPGIIHLTTNGILTDTILNTLKKVEPLNKIHIKISIDNIGDAHDKTRGVHGAYSNAMETLKKLVELRDKINFHIGVNQVVVSEKEINSYFQLKDILDEFEVPLYPVIANEPTNSLYSDKQLVDPKISFKTFGEFSQQELRRFMNILVKNGKEVSNLKEQIVNRYHLKGLYNRLVENKNTPNPKCVAMNNHLRLLPNGDVPVCLYNGTVVGNLRKNKFKDIWFNDEATKHRNWVKKCPGCWQSCETAVSGIYTGDIWKGLFYK